MLDRQASSTSRTTLLNVLERQLSAPANYRSGISALLTTKLLQDWSRLRPKVAMLGWLGPTVVGSGMPYPFGPGSMAGRTEPGPGTAEMVTGST